jgi:hypothetical protein
MQSCGASRSCFEGGLEMTVQGIANGKNVVTGISFQQAPSDQNLNLRFAQLDSLVMRHGNGPQCTSEVRYTIPSTPGWLRSC